ncbi:MAG: alpha/beta fold hydrolase [Actinobacteria bacterium]|nr:alpha/beta fold hydrolase [Actinomycetota bacterium]
MRRFALALTTTLLIAAGCSDRGSEATEQPNTTDAAKTIAEPTVTDASAAATSTDATSTTSVGSSFADRPYDVFVPSGYDPATAAPLVILLHGYGASGALQDIYFQLQPQAESRGFLYVHPDAIPNVLGKTAWNATDACCVRDESPDDSAYITHIIDEVSAAYNVDPVRIYLVGHSNGGFMSYRMACDHADRIAAIVSLAGATFADATNCAPSEPVNVLQIHGTNDEIISYDGGEILEVAYPGAQTTVATWAAYNGCATVTDSLGALDLDPTSDGGETSIVGSDACPVDGAVELWTIENGTHIPPLAPNFGAEVIDWLYAHPNAS